MNKHLSVWMAAARGIAAPLALLVLVMAAAEGVLLWRAYPESAASGLTCLLENAPLIWVYRGALILLAAACCLHGSGLGGSAVGATLGRLRVSELTVVLWWSLCYAMAFAILWAAQTGILLGTGACYMAQAAPSMVSPQTMLLTSWQVPFFHALLPLDQWSGYVRTVSLCLGAGTGCAAWSFWRRRSAHGYAAPFVVILWAATLTVAPASFAMDLFLSFGVLSAAAVSLYLIREEVRYHGDPH